MLIARPVQQRQGLISRSHGGGYHREGGGLDVLLLGSSDELVSDCPRLVWFPPIRIDDCLARHPPRVSARDRERRLVYRQRVIQSPGAVIRRCQDDLREVRIRIPARPNPTLARPPRPCRPRPARGPPTPTAAR